MASSTTGSDDWEVVDVTSSPASPAFDDEFEIVDRFEATPTDQGPRGRGRATSGKIAHPQLTDDEHEIVDLGEPSGNESTSKPEPMRGPPTGMTREERALVGAMFNPDGSLSSTPLTPEQRARTSSIEGDEFSRLHDVIGQAPRAIGTSIVEDTKQAYHGAMAAHHEQYAADVRKMGPRYDALDYAQQDLPPTDEERQVGDIMASGAEQSAIQHLVEGAQAGARQQAAMPPRATQLDRDVIGGIASGVTSGATMLASTAVTGSPVPGILAMGASSAAQRYAQVRAAGVPVDQAQASALANGALESLTEFLPGESLVKRSPLGKKAMEFFISDILGENASSLGQLADDYRLQLRDDVTGQDLIDSMKSTTVQSLVGGAVQVSGSHAVQMMVDAANQRAAARKGGSAPVAADEVLGPVEGPAQGPAKADDFEVVDLKPESAAPPVSGAAPAAPAAEAPNSPVAEAAEAAPKYHDERLADEGVRSALEESRRDIGTERGGRLIREDGDTGDVTGRTSHLATEFWKDRPTEGGKISAAEAHTALDNAKTGGKLNARQRRYVDYTLDEIDKRKAEWDEFQKQEAPRHEAEIAEAIPDFHEQDETTQLITRVAKVAAQYATEDEVVHALEAQDDSEALARLQKLVDRGWQERNEGNEQPAEVRGPESTAANADDSAISGSTSETEGAPNVEDAANKAGAGAAGLEQTADAGEAKPAEVARGEEAAVPSDEAGLKDEDEQFFPSADGKRVRISTHKKGSNLLDPTSDVGAFVYTVSASKGDANPLNMVLDRDGKLVTLDKVLNGNNSNGRAWVPPTPRHAAEARRLLRARAETTTIGSKERAAIDKQLVDLVTGTGGTRETDLFGAGVESTAALNKKQAAVDKKLGKGKGAIAPENAPTGDIFRAQADKEDAAAAAAQTDIESAAAVDTARKEAKARGTEHVIDAAAAEAASSAANETPEPTNAQKEAGNYAKGHFSMHGLDFAIENPRGSWRWKMDTGQLDELVKQARVEGQETPLVRAQEALRDNARIPEAFSALQGAEDRLIKTHPKLAKGVSRLLNKSWSARLAADYGYIKGHIGKDKDHVDVYVDLPVLAENPNNPVWVMDQKNSTGDFDEHKVFMGFENAQRIEADFVKSFDDKEFARTIFNKPRKFANVAAFKEWLTTGDLNKPVAQWKPDVQRASPNPEQDRTHGEVTGDEGAVQRGRNEKDASPNKDGGQPTEGHAKQRADELHDGAAAAAGERGNQPLRDEGGKSGTAQPPPGSDESGAGADTGGAGASDDLFGAADPVAAAESAAPALDRAEKVRRQLKAEPYKVELGDRKNIALNLPFLLEGQHGDVEFAEKRHAKPEGYGVVFTNGTGTGKTYSGLGILKRQVKLGKKNHLIVVPSQKIVDDWVKSAKDLGLNIEVLEDTKSNGSKGMSITTFANFGANETLADRAYDSVTIDEAHMLMQNEAAEDTAALDTLRAITLHPDGWYRRAQMIHRVEWNALQALAAEVKTYTVKKDIPPADLVARLEEARRVFDELAKPVKAHVAANQGAKRPRATFLSATPFAYEKNVRWANGYLFDWGKDQSKGYNQPDAYEAFMIQHFGYRMRVGKLTEPEAAVDRTVMQRQFNTWLKKEGALAGRILEEPYDYDRKFVLVDSKVGTKIDEGLEWLRDQDMRELEREIRKKFDYLARSRLLEALKAREAAPYIKAQHKLGRKVIVFYDFNEGGGYNIFDVPIPDIVDAGEFGRDLAEQSKRLREQVIRFRKERQDLVELDTTAPSPLGQLMKAFPNAKQYNGLFPAKKRTLWVDAFNNDSLPEENLILAQKQANAGWSGHDTSGKHQRVLINLGLPTAPVQAIQIEGRIYRVGQRSDAMFRYFNTGTSWERTAFASTISRRASTAENLAMGELARGLKDSFIEAFEESGTDTPGSPEDGKGGKARDRALAATISEFDRAKAFYFSNQKKNSRTKSAEGKDYFATPEPVGFKMVDWAQPAPTDDLLEPSAGHGAIARFFPELQKRTVIEPSNELGSKLQLLTDAKYIQGQFENHDRVNKYDVIVMNPPFGHGGATAIEHLNKAFTEHLRTGGRLVALIPEGGMADRAFEKWINSTDGAHLMMDVGLPQVTFERAGTGAKTHIVVIDKLPSPEALKKAYDTHTYELAQPKTRRDIDATDIKELFNRIEEMEAPPRIKDITQEARTKEYEAATAAIEEKKARKEETKAAAKAGKNFTSVDSTHTKTGKPVYYAVQSGRVDPDVYHQRNDNAKKLGGYYSNFGKIKGFLFTAAAERDAFIAQYDGKGASTEDHGALKDASVVRADKVRTPVSRAALQAHIETIGKAIPLTDIYVIEGFDGIQEQDKKGFYEFAMRSNVGSLDFGGIMWKRPNGRNVIYLNSLTQDSLSDAEKVLFHEAFHRGIRAAIGEAQYQKLTDMLFVQMGGAKAFPRENKLYFEKRGDPFDVNNPVHRKRMVDEALAQLSEYLNRGESLTDQLKQLLDKVLAWINSFLRRNGWRRTFSLAEIKEAVRSATEIGLRQSTRNDTIETPAREMAQFSAQALQEAQRRRPAVKVTDEGLFALRDDDRQATERQHQFWESLKKGQYIERAVRMAFLPPGLTVNEKGEWTPTPLGRRIGAKVRDSSMRAARRSFGFLRPLHESVIRQYQVDEKVKSAIAAVKNGLVDRWNTPPEFVLADYASQNYKTQLLDRAKKMVADLETSGMVSNRAEAEALQAILTGENPAQVDAAMAAVAEPIRQLVDQWGMEAVELGLLDRATYERNRATYLHRVYRKHEADVMGAGPMVKRVEQAQTTRRRKIIGNQLKRRGISFNVTLDALRRNLPADWWARKTDNKKIDVALGESEWIVLSKLKNPREGTPDMLNGDTKGKDRVVDRVYLPADGQIPASFAGWRNDGTFKAIKVTPAGVELWRDFTKDERTKMGEILDARYTFLKTALTAAHDLATGRLFRDIANNPEWSRELPPTADDGTPLWTEANAGRRKYSVDHEWVHVPDNTIPGTSAKRYGQMAGKYILASIWRDMNELEMGMQPSTMKWVMTQFKKNKTTRNPKTHMFNTMSNVVLAYIDDMRASEFAKGIKEWYSNGPMWEEARLHGVFGHDFVEQEIKQSVLKPMLERILKESNADAMNERKFKQLFRVMSGLRSLDEKATWAYQAEDEVFRMASYMQARKQGMGPDEAAMHARRQFIDYDIRAPWINKIRSTVVPFISYPYRAIPRVMDAVAKRPWKIATLALLSYALNEVFYAMADDPDEDLERRLMNEHARGHTWAYTPRMVRLPFNDEYENPVFLDMRNGLPAANIVDFENSYSTVPTPAWLQIGGPLVMGVDFMQNYDAYRQDPIADQEVDTLGQKASKGAKFLWAGYMPSWAPGGYSWDRVAGALQGRMNQAHETSSIGMAVAQSVLPISVQSTEKNRRDRIREYDRKVRALSEQASDLRHDFQKIKDPSNDDREDLRRALQEINSRRDQVNRERHITLHGDEDE